MANFLNIDVEEKAIDLAASSAGASEMSTAMNERKMHIWLQHRKRSHSKWMYTLSMGVSIAVFLASWFVFETVVSRNYYFSKGVYKAAESMSYIFFGLSESILMYFKRSNQIYCQEENFVGAQQISILNEMYGTSNIYSYLSDQQLKYMNQTGVDMDKLQSEVILSDNFFGADIYQWLKNTETDFNSQIGKSSYVQSSFQLKMPTLAFFQAVNSLLARLRWLRDEELRTNHNLTELKKSDMYLDLTNSMVNSAFQLVMKRILNGYQSMVDLLQASTYTTYFTILLWMSGSILAICYLMMLGALWSIQKFLSSALHGYSLLQKRDLSYEIEKLNHCLNFFEYGEAFDEKESMTEAVAAFIKTSGKDRAKYYNEFGNQKTKTSKVLASSKYGEESVGKQAVRDLRRNQASKFKSSKLYRGVMRALTMGTLLIVLVVATLALTLVVNGLVKDSRDLKLMVMGSSSLLLSMELDFSFVTIYSPYSVKILSSSWNESRKLLYKYREDQQSFIGFWNEWRTPMKNMLGNNNTIENIIYGNLCQEIINYNKLDQNWPICQNLNQKIATKGLIAFSVYENSYLEDISNRLETWINLSSPNPPQNINSTVINEMASMFYSSYAIQLRSGHSSIYNQVLKTINTYAESVSAQKEAQVDTLIATLRIVGLAVVFLPFVFLIFNTSKYIKRDYLTALYTFEIMSPDTVLYNQYLLTKFKKFFKTTSY